MSFRENQPSEPGWEKVGCILCDGNPATTVIWPDAESGDLRQCRGCGLVFRSPRRSEDYLRRHFAEQWTEACPSFFLEDYRGKI